MTTSLCWLEILRSTSLTVNGFGITLIVHQTAFTFIPWHLSRSKSCTRATQCTSNDGLTITLIPGRDIFCSKSGLTRLLDVQNLNLALGRIQTLWCGALEVREGMYSADTCFFRDSARQRYLLHGADFKRSWDDKRTLNSNKPVSSRTLKFPYPFPSGISVRGGAVGRMRKTTNSSPLWLIGV